MNTPAHHHRPRRGRVYAATAAAAVLTVAGLVLLVTASGQLGESVPATAGAPSSTLNPSSPSPPPPGAVAGGSVSSTSDAAAPGPSGDPGGPVAPGQPVPASGPGPSQPGNSGGTDAGGAGVSGQPGSVAISDSARRAALAGVPAGMPPDSLAIPSLGVAAPLGPICAEPGGVLEPPVNSAGMLCIWHGSAQTGNSGMETLAGHINYGRIPNAALSRLAQMRPGDTIYTNGQDGTHAWVVRSSFERSKSLPLDAGAFAGPDGPRQLVLISCGGALIPGLRSYANNVYVFALPA